MEKQIIHVRGVAASCLPENVTLDFVPHDRELFRFVHHVTADVEDEISKRKYPLRNCFQGTNEGIARRILNDTEELRRIDEEEKDKYCVVIANGLSFYEGVQEQQDACVKINMLFGENMWCSVNKDEMKKVEELTKLGAFDEFGIIQEPPEDPVLLTKILKILESPFP